MPHKNVTHTHVSEEAKPIAIGYDGREIAIGDFVDLRFIVTGIRILINPRTGEESGQIIEVAHNAKDGYNEQYLACPAFLGKKADEGKPEGQP